MLLENRMNKKLAAALRILSWISLAVFPALCLFVAEYIHFASKTRFFSFLAERTPVVIFDLMVLYAVFAALLLIFKRAWVGALLLSLLCGAGGIADYLKYLTVNENFYPWDLVQVKNIGLVTSYVKFTVPALYIAMVVVLGLYCLWCVLTRTTLPLRWYIRLPIAAILIFVCVWQIRTPDQVTQLLNSHSLYLEDMAMQDSNYDANGLVGAFTVNVLSSRVDKPSGYSEASVSAAFEGYEGEAASEDFNSPDIILVLSESYWDPRDLPGTTFSYDPMEQFDDLASKDGVISGRFFTTGFGGGTVRPDFEVLTGLTTDGLPSGSVPYQYISKDGFPSYVSLLDDLGYDTTSIHPYTASFYARAKAYPKIGFDELYFADDLEELEGLDITMRGGRISDDTFADAIMQILDSKSGSPAFIWGISIENHQSYEDKFPGEELNIDVYNSSLDDETLSLVRNYSQGVADASACLEKLAEYVDSRERDTILIWFGDHAPTLGTNCAAYCQSGLISDPNEITAEERMITQSTPFLIYSNFELSDSAKMLHVGDDNQIASYNLMNAVFELIGGPSTPMMELLRDFDAECPYYNIRMNITPSDTLWKYIENHRLITYDRLKGNMYSISK